MTAWGNARHHTSPSCKNQRAVLLAQRFREIESCDRSSKNLSTGFYSGHHCHLVNPLWRAGMWHTRRQFAHRISNLQAQHEKSSQHVAESNQREARQKATCSCTQITDDVGTEEATHMPNRVD